MPKKGEKVINEEQLEKLAMARKKALEVRRANKDIKDKEKELIKLEKEDKRKDLDNKISARKQPPQDIVGNEVNIPKENLEIVVKDKPKPKKKVKYVYEDETDSSDEEVVVVKKKKKDRAKKIAEPEVLEQDDKQDTEPPPPSIARQQAEYNQGQQALQRQHYLQQVSQLPQYRTNLFGRH
jgi:hypothetical protein